MLQSGAQPSTYRGLPVTADGPHKGVGLGGDRGSGVREGGGGGRAETKPPVAVQFVPMATSGMASPGTFRGPHRHWRTDRQTERQTERQIERQIERQRGR